MNNKPDTVGGQSPTPIEDAQVVGMNFTEAIEEIVKGQKVTRLEWNNEDYCFLDEKSEQLYIFVKGKLHTWVISKGDLMGEDWVTV